MAARGGRSSQKTHAIEELVKTCRLATDTLSEDGVSVTHFLS